MSVSQTSEVCVIGPFVHAIVRTFRSFQKVEQHDAGTWVRTVGTTTETDCLGPCEPGTSVTLEGIVWQETAGGKFSLYDLYGNAN